MLGRWVSTDLIGAVIFLSTDSSSYVTQATFMLMEVFQKRYLV